MSTRSDTLKMIERVDPQKLDLYLRARGWDHVYTLSGALDVWTISEPEAAEIRAPRKSGWVDFSRLMYDALHTLEDVEGRSILQVITDVTNVGADVVRVRCDPNMLGLGTIPIDEGLGAFQHAKGLMLSAARSAWLPQNAYASKPVGEVQTFMKAAQFDQTEIGSYVIKMLCPVIVPGPSQTTIEPFARKATAKLSEGLAALDRAAKAWNVREFASFKEAVDEGVSANLCDAVVGLSKASHDNAVGVDILWAPGPERPPARVERTIAADMIGTIERASVWLKGLSPEMGVQLDGEVIVLTRERGLAGTSDVSLLCQVDGRDRRVLLTVTGDFRAKLIDAFDKDRAVNVSGTLDRSKPRYMLVDITNVQVLDKPAELGL